MRARIALLTTAALVAAIACSDLKHAEDEPPPGDDGGGTTDGPVGGGDGAADGESAEDGGDAGQPPVDFECTEAWTKATKTKSECAPRQVKIVDSDGRPDTEDISIAHTSAGRVAIAYYAPEFIDQGDMRLLHFIAANGSFTPAMITRPGGLALQAGYDVKLAASNPDTIHVLAHDVDDTTSGDVVAMKLVGGIEPLTDPELVVAGVQQKTQLAFSADGSGNLFATALFRTGTKDGGGTLAKLVARKKVGAAAFASMPDVITDLTPDDAPGVGATSLFVDGAGTLNLLYQFCDAQFSSQPRHHLFDGSNWSLRKTVDNGALDGFSGFSPRLAVSGTKKIAAYFYRKGAQAGTATADLRVATWTLASDMPAIEIVDQGIPSADQGAPRYRVAMAVDKFGLIHLAVVRPANATSGTLDYVRQTRVAGGGTKWLSDIVDEEVLGDGQEAAVDIVVDENARPHIAYRSAADLKIRYATRYDR